MVGNTIVKTVTRVSGSLGEAAGDAGAWEGEAAGVS